MGGWLHSEQALAICTTELRRCQRESPAARTRDASDTFNWCVGTKKHVMA